MITIYDKPLTITAIRGGEGLVSLEEVAARILIEAGSVRRGRYMLASGVETDIYIDARSLLGKPKYMKRILALLYTAFASHIEGKAIVGVATGGIPWATGLALISGSPLGYVRPTTKDHGMARRIEGLENGMESTVIDDVATTGGSIANAITALRAEGFRVETAIVIVDRESGAREKLSGMGVSLLGLTRLSIIRNLLSQHFP